MLTQDTWHWTCNGKIFYNKIDSIVESLSSEHPIHYHATTIYNEHTLCIEPAQSWHDILRDRALQLRDQHKHINLWFSGGCDSTRMLHAFIDNDVFIDEITLFKSGIDSADYEIDYALKYLAKHKSKLLNTRINEYTLTLKDYEEFYSDPQWHTKVTTSNPITFRNLTFIHLLGGRHGLDEGKTNIWGHQKPELTYVNNKWYAYFLDANNDKSDTAPLEHSVWFFTENTTVHAKQCHMLKRHIEATYKKEQYNTPSKMYQIHQKDINYGSGRLDAYIEYFIPKAVNSGTNIQHNDNTYHSASAKEHAAVQTMLTVDVKLMQKYKAGCDEILSKIGHKWLNKGRPEFGSIGVHSKFYCLDAPEIKTVDDLFPNGYFG